jgi:hypothetical protein
MIKSKGILVFVGIFLIAISYSCKETSIDQNSANTSDLVQNSIMATSCATSGCHASAADANFNQHGLILTGADALSKMIDKTPKNITAIEEGLKLIKPFDAENSLFYQKLLFESNHKSEKNFGSIMPLGKDMLFKGQIEYIRRWIEAGAPLKGNVADVSLLNDKTPVLTKFEPLAAPKAGEGYQMKLEPFEIYPYFEREVFIQKPLGNTEPTYINKFQLKMQPGSHHFIMYGFRNNQNLPLLNVYRDLRNKDMSLNFSTFLEMSNHVFYFGGSESNFTFNFPEGTAVELPANMKFDMNSHYFNKGAKSYNGEVNINLYTVKKENVKNVLKILDYGNNELSIPAKQKTVITKSFTFNKNVKIVTLFSHTHKLGEKFEILLKGGPRDGQVVYTNTNWEHPAKIDYKEPLAIKKGEGLTSRITYNNFTDKIVKFGLTSEDEMGIIFGYYYEE